MECPLSTPTHRVHWPQVYLILRIRLVNVIYTGECAGGGELLESVDASFHYLKWDWESNVVVESIPMFPQSASYLEEELGVLCTVIQGYVFIASSAGYVRAFSLHKKNEIGKIQTENRTSPISFP